MNTLCRKEICKMAEKERQTYRLLLKKLFLNGNQVGLENVAVGDILAITDADQKKRSQLVVKAYCDSSAGIDAVLMINSVLYNIDYAQDKDGDVGSLDFHIIKQEDREYHPSMQALKDAGLVD